MQDVVTRTGRIGLLWLVVTGATLEAQSFVTLIEPNQDPLEASRSALVTAREALLDARRTLDDALFRVDASLLALERAQAERAAALAATRDGSRPEDPATASGGARAPTAPSLADAECEDESAAKTDGEDTANGLAAWRRFVRGGEDAARESAALATATIVDAVEFCRPHVERFLQETAAFVAAREAAGSEPSELADPEVADGAPEQLVAGEGSSKAGPAPQPAIPSAGDSGSQSDVEVTASTGAPSTGDVAAPAVKTATAVDGETRILEAAAAGVAEEAADAADAPAIPEPSDDRVPALPAAAGDAPDGSP